MQKYSGGRGSNDASSAFVHLIRWFQPDATQLQAFLRRIYTDHRCLMHWTFSVKDVAQYLGPHMVRLLSPSLTTTATLLYLFIIFPLSLFFFFDIHHPQIQLWMMANSDGLGDQLLPPSSSDRVASLTQLCLDMSDESFLLLCIFVRYPISFF